MFINLRFFSLFSSDYFIYFLVRSPGVHLPSNQFLLFVQTLCLHCYWLPQSSIFCQYCTFSIASSSAFAVPCLAILIPGLPPNYLQFWFTNNITQFSSTAKKTTSFPSLTGIPEGAENYHQAETIFMLCHKEMSNPFITLAVFFFRLFLKVVGPIDRLAHLSGLNL